MKKSYVVVAVVAIIIIAAAAAVLLLNVKAKPYSVSEDGILSYGARPAPNFTISLYNDTDIATIYKVVFRSRDRNIYGLLSIPKSIGQAGSCTTFILLPANSIPKESEQSWLGTDLNKRGYCAFSLDQRGVGTAADAFVNLDADLGRLTNGEEPESYKMFYDALAAFDVLSSGSVAGGTNSNALGAINKSAIYMAGESMGGRVAIIAGAMEPRVAGVVGISTGGYGVPSHQDYKTQIFIRSIDPDNYAKMISPRKLLLLHSKYDQTISSLAANRTYDYAAEPKLLLLDEGTDHGYYRHEKVASLNDGLDWLLGTSGGSTSVEIANPASQYCVNQGGSVLIVDTPAGQAGYCQLPGSSTMCEEWALFRTGNCSAPNI